MYIGVNGEIVKNRIDQIKDALIFNFSIDKLDIPFNVLYGIRKNIPNNNSSVIEETLKTEISQMITDRPFFKGVIFEGLTLINDKVHVVVTVDKETLSIPL